MTVPATRASARRGSMFGYGDIQLYAGSGSQELAQEISQYLSVPLSGYDLVEFPNENLFVRLHGSAPPGAGSFI